MKKTLTLIFFCILSFSQAQIGGRSVYQFLNVVPSARVAAQGGNAIANTSPDLNFALWNPSLLNKEMHNQVSISMVDYLSDILLGDVSYARHYDSIGTFYLGLRYLDYGDFDRRDQIGIDMGNFSAVEMAVNLGYGYELDTNWSFGGNMKFIHSRFDVFQSAGLALDLSATYKIPQKRIAIALVAKNIGTQFTAYNEERESLPFELQLGFSNRLEHLPLRWQITFEHLETFDLLYDDPSNRTVNQLTGAVEDDSPGMINNILRHMVLGLELAPTKSFNVQFGYNFRKRQELNLDTRRTAAGFSFGIGIRISKFRINYARNMYHVAGGANNFSIITDLGDFNKE
ncbi:MAG: type IX secretion system protein PorQ [Owenweeksia sp.]|nr:type IX secretion system protein PorQ [Owenweeksia sp.]